MQVQNKTKIEMAKKKKSKIPRKERTGTQTNTKYK